MVRLAAIVLGLGAAAAAACSRPAPSAPLASVAAGGGGGGVVTLYRDRALVQQRIELDVPAGGPARVRVQIAAGVRPGDVMVLDRGTAEIRELRAIPAPPAAAPPPTAAAAADAPDAPDASDTSEAIEVTASSGDGETAIPPPQPVELELVVGAPRPGRIALHLGYVTDRLTWEAVYTLTTTPARTHAAMRGALVIRNASGIDLRGVVARIVDTDFEVARSRSTEALVFGPRGVPGARRRRVPPPPEVPPRELGRLDLVDGDTRVELVREPQRRAMRSVLVYDPIGVKHDHAGSSPVRDRDLGVAQPAPRRVEESYELVRDAAATAGLPAGPARLLERRGDGSLVLIGESRLFEAGTRVANVDTIPVGTAAGVTGRRERRELTIDDVNKRLTEEFVLTIDNKRPEPVEVVLREHLYRSQTWTLSFISVPAGPEAKEGPQQVAPRITVPPRAVQRVLYVVVYPW